MMPLWVAVLALLLGNSAAYHVSRPIPTFSNFDFSTHPKAWSNRNADFHHVPRCRETWRNSTLDHFAWSGDGGFDKFPQRVFFCDEYWKNTTEETGPIFLYLGNEAGVEKYIEATGLMWELAPKFGALLVFIEHRYYGKSKPYGDQFWEHLEYLSAEQALADYAEFLFEFQSSIDDLDVPVIGFGGSYGGMLGAWMRMKYPHSLHGVIASSAPIWSFEGEVPPADPNYFDKIKTYSASLEAGCAAECVPNIRRTWGTLFYVFMSEGADAIRQSLNLCSDVKIDELVDVWSVIHWIDHAITIMAEGSYSFPCDYMTDGVAKLPPYPLRLGCSYLAEPLEELELLAGVGMLVESYYNVTKDVECYSLEREVSEEGKEISELWGHQYCTEMFQLFGSDGVHDMFWSDPWEVEPVVAYCKQKRGVESRPYQATQQWGGKHLSTLTNAIFSNGEYDPWRGGGVQYNVSDTAVAVIILEGGHHADLMFSTDLDNESLKAARLFEEESIARWIQEVRDKNEKIKAQLEAAAEATPSSPSVESSGDLENSDRSDYLEAAQKLMDRPEWLSQTPKIKVVM